MSATISAALRTGTRLALVLWMLGATGLVRAAQSNPNPTLMNRIEEKEFGQMPDGTVVKQFTLRNSSGMVVKVMSYGATITEVDVPDRDGKTANVILGADTFEAYLKGFPAAASVIGRVANRIAKASFTLDRAEYKLDANDGANSIHGGRTGFAHRVWEAKALEPGAHQAAVQFSYFSKDGEEGYPGNLTARVTYTLTDNNELRLDYEAETDKPTLVNLTNHCYFNLAGKGDVLTHELSIAAHRYTPADGQLIPTGEIASVQGTPLDFTKPTPIGARIEQLKPRVNGYDHNYVLDKVGATPNPCARVRDPESGRVMTVTTTQPGVQLYTGNHLKNVVGTGGVVFGSQHPAFCLETQHFPDSIHHPNFPSIVLRPEKKFQSTTVFAFSAK